MNNVSDFATEWIKSHGGTLLSEEELATKLADIDKQAEEKAAADYLALKRKVYDRDSLWPSNRKATFTFERWLPERQTNVKLATKIKNQATDIFKRLRSDNFNIFILGNAGTGKTAITLALVNALERYSHKTVMFVSTVALREAVMYEFSDLGARAKLDRIAKSMQEVDVLILDDFGSEVGMSGNGKQATERLQQFYMRVADARYEVDENDKRTKSTIVTSNNVRSELEGMYNDKLISRLVTKKTENVLLFAGLEDIR